MQLHKYSHDHLNNTDPTNDINNENQNHNRTNIYIYIFTYIYIYIMFVVGAFNAIVTSVGFVIISCVCVCYLLVLSKFQLRREEQP